MQPLGTSFAPASKSPSVTLRRRHVKHGHATNTNTRDPRHWPLDVDVDVDVATATRIAAANDVPAIFNRPLARRKESNEASTNATVIDIRPAEEKEQRNGKPGAAQGGGNGAR